MINSSDNDKKLELKNKLEQKLARYEKLHKCGKLNDAIPFIEEVISDSIKNDFPELKFRALLAKGVILRKMGNYEDALKHYRKALLIPNNFENKKGLAGCYNNMGIIFKDLGKYDQALEYYFKSLDIREAVGDSKKSANVLNNIGVIYNILNMKDKSESFFIKSLNVRIKSGDQYDIAASYNNLGAFYYSSNDFAKALKYYSNSLKIKEEIQDIPGIAITTNNLGLIYNKQGNVKKAIEFHEKSLEMRKVNNDIKGIIISNINLANDYIADQKYPKAEEIINDTIKQANEFKNDRLLVKCYSTLTELKEKQGDYKSSLQYNKKYYQMQNQLISQETRNKINQLQSKHDSEINKLKNVKLRNLALKIRNKNRELRKHRSHLKLINRILRHDIKNKLATTQSSLRLFKSLGEVSYLNECTKSINASIKLIDKMRELETMISKNSKLKIYNLFDVITQVLNSHPEMKSNILKLNKKTEVLADSAISSMLDNIISNVHKHAGVNEMMLKITDSDKWTEVRIIDKGIGIPKEIQDRIFEEGFTYGETGNTGTGLFIVKKTIETYGGFIYHEQNKPSGSIFVMNFKRIN